MIILLKRNAERSKVDDLIRHIHTMNVQTQEIPGVQEYIIALIGDTSAIDPEDFKSIDIVAKVKRIQEPYKKANRKFHPEDTIITVGDRKFGAGHFQVIAGPCSVESREQMISVANSVKESGAGLMRGGAFKPRTSPYAFQGLREEGLRLLLEAKKHSGMPIVTEIMDKSHLPLFDDVDVIQVGARNMQNYELLKALGKVDKPILLKRGLSSTLDELIMSAEYIMDGGNEKIIFCERGIRTFETATRNTLDLSAVPILKQRTHLPVIVDPSHASGIWSLVEPLSMAAIAVGADGLIIEVHNDPAHALCDGAQSLTPENFEETMKKVKRAVEFFGKTMD